MPLLPLTALALSVSAAQPAPGQPTHRNGFDITSSAIATEEILAGGPPRDGIPALDRPPSVPASEAGWPDDSFVLGVQLAGEARADVVIVGGGFCGLWTALAIKEREPSRDVVVIERDICGGGA
ncbi:MAG: FAD-dependent oxidoreductase, partial [Myxococcota bacterium]